MLRSGKGRNVVGREMMQTRIAYFFFFFVHVEINKFLNEVGTKFIIIRGTEISMCVNFIYDRWIRDYFTTKKII